MSSFHDFKINSIEGKEIDFSTFKGKKILVVNVASKCGHTPQYRQLQELYVTHQDKLVVVGFPCNDFGGQEPAPEPEIKGFCEVRYGVTFPLTEKVKTKAKKCHPIYQWLKTKELNGKMDSEVRWNFQKYLIDENGRWLAMFEPAVNPLDEEILNWLV